MIPEEFAGVLLLSDNKTYGRKKQKMLYRCVVCSSRSANSEVGLPTEILVPYQIKWGFSKHPTNQYITFRFQQQQTEGEITNVLGPVDSLDAYYEFKLFENHCKWNFQKQNIRGDQLCLPPDNSVEIITIDGEETQCFDDAFTYSEQDRRLVIYVAYVADIKDHPIWDAWIKKRVVSSLYLSVVGHIKKINMLPNSFTTERSLIENQPRKTVALELWLDENGNATDRFSWSEQIIQVSKNYSYEEGEKHHMILALKALSFFRDRRSTAPTVVAQMMAWYNEKAGETLFQKKTGLFIDFDRNFSVSQPTSTWCRPWKKKYYYFDELSPEVRVLLYARATSPLRRWEDIYNQMGLLDWVAPSRIHNMDVVTRIVKRMQNEISLMTWISMNPNPPPMMGTVVQKEETDCSHSERGSRKATDSDCSHSERGSREATDSSVEDGSNGVDYLIALTDIKLTSWITTDADFDLGTQHMFQIFIFEDEYKLHKKVRIKHVVNINAAEAKDNNAQEKNAEEKNAEEKNVTAIPPVSRRI
jgi:NADH:ubiquinone oxidoreductase subunit